MSGYHPSIFNDVLGPVMRGPSSSHVAAALRIGRVARDIMGGCPETVRVDYDIHGSLASTHDGQGSDMGLYSGLLGWEATDERMPKAEAHLAQAGCRVEIRKDAFGHGHPNTYHLVMTRGDRAASLTAISTGGGMIEIQAIDGIALTSRGDFFETLLFLPGRVMATTLRDVILWKADPDEIRILGDEGFALVQVKGQAFLEEGLIEELTARFAIQSVVKIRPVLPVLSRRGLAVPFLTAGGLQDRLGGRDRALWELALDYECARGGLSEDAVLERMDHLVSIWERAIDQGLAGTRYNDRILPAQAPGYSKAMEKGRLLPLGAQDEVIRSVAALMEVKSAMGVVIAAPTAGACGTLPGTIFGTAKTLGRDREAVVRALLAAGLVGVFIAHAATFAAEVGGCQAETGSGAGMAAAGLVTLMDGTLEQALNAASLALQNTFGLVCDPVANRVEAPCLGKNVLMAGNALSCANMALAGFDALIPLDEVITAMHQVGQAIPCELRCTGKGGLSVTPTALEIEKRLEKATA